MLVGIQERTQQLLYIKKCMTMAFTHFENYKMVLKQKIIFSIDIITVMLSSHHNRHYNHP